MKTKNQIKNPNPYKEVEEEAVEKDRNLKITNKNVDHLIPYINNARTHSKDQIALIASSIKEFGFINPVLIDMSFNCGVHGLLEFKKMLSALENNNPDLAAEEMLNSKWATKEKGIEGCL